MFSSSILIRSLAASIAAFSLAAPAFAAATLDARYSGASVRLKAEENTGPSNPQQDFNEGQTQSGTSQGYGSITTTLIDESITSPTNGWATASGTAQASSSFIGGDGSTTFDAFTFSDASTLDLAVSSDPPGTFGNTVGLSSGTNHNVFFTITQPHDWSFTGTGTGTESASGNFPSVSADDADWTFFISEIGGPSLFVYETGDSNGNGAQTFSGTLAAGTYHVGFGTGNLPGNVTNFSNGSASFDSSFDGTFALTIIPEPASALLLAATGGLVLMRRRRGAKAATLPAVAICLLIGGVTAESHAATFYSSESAFRADAGPVMLQSFESFPSSISGGLDFGNVLVSGFGGASPSLTTTQSSHGSRSVGFGGSVSQSGVRLTFDRPTSRFGISILDLQTVGLPSFFSFRTSNGGLPHTIRSASTPQGFSNRVEFGAIVGSPFQWAELYFSSGGNGDFVAIDELYFVESGGGSWLNASNTNNEWARGSNWGSGFSPGSANDAEFTLNSAYNVAFTSNAQANLVGVTAGDVTFQMNGRSLVASNLQVGVGTGSATATINGGGSVTSNASSVIGDNGGSGVLNVDGAGTTFTQGGGGFTYVGATDDGYGELNITSGGTVVSQKAIVGWQTGARGITTVEDAGSLWEVQTNLDIGGYSSTGDNATDTGRVIVRDDGLVTVAGATTVWTGTGGLANKLAILDGGTFETGSLVFLDNTPIHSLDWRSGGTLVITDSDVELNDNPTSGETYLGEDLVVGEGKTLRVTNGRTSVGRGFGSTASLTVQDGGAAELRDIVLADTDESVVSMTVSGSSTGGQASTVTASSLTVGQEGDAMLTIDQGAVFTVTNHTGLGWIDMSYVNGDVLIDNASMNNQGMFVVGGRYSSGTDSFIEGNSATLTVQNGGELVVGNTLKVFDGRTVNLSSGHRRRDHRL